ncbi:hypothetical protein [Paraburkholderia domus]|jgi:hypothetical protein|uniref:hypothetical protein n=1 Tax=Paraburkholderia domus TaxID=2793075 RepID=UPI001B2B38DA|nr:hypothetical protein [Paraburkholderia domus]CAE6969109.1 hypothetical protein R70199_08014 [Paraburkholderia domus]
MNEPTAMDDRFDRRELLLHLGDILEASNCLAQASRPTAAVAHLMREDDSLLHFEFLRALAPTMTVAEFTKRVASAFFPWPRELLAAELNRDALAASVQHNLFDGDLDGWNAYVTYVQRTVAWFGTGRSTVKAGASAGPARDAAKDATPAEVSAVATLPAKSDAPIEKRGWPWPEPRSKS